MTAVGDTLTELIKLFAGSAELVIAPELGGGIASLDWDDKPVLRRWSGDEENPFSLACNTLVPFSNRISGGGFTWDGQRFTIAPNLCDEACAIHGDGFQRAWSVTAQNETQATLDLAHGEIGPFRYRARQVFDLSTTALRVVLSVINTGNQTLPFGCGFHPWFPRDSDTRLRFNAEGIWLEDASYLPTQWLPMDDAPHRSFAQARAVPEHWINNAYTGWGGCADILQGKAFVSTRVVASTVLDTAIVFSTGKGGEFLCFEPVSHAVDAINQIGHPGLMALAPGQTMNIEMSLEWG